MTDRPSEPVRAFISYSWSSLTHETWVLNLASRLREDGVDVILDKWDLKPGHDANAFMESMVTDESVTKVMMICDKVYTTKANGRSGGVGTESQIISPEIYKASRQDKYAALVTEQDEEGKPFIPVFYSGRIFFDFCSGDRFEESYEQLLRWLVDRPSFVKPKLGQVPEALLGAAPVASGTRSALQRALKSIQEMAPSGPALVREMGERLIAEVKALAPLARPGEPEDDIMLEAVASMRPYLHQLAELTRTICRFAADRETWDRLLDIVEGLGALMFRAESENRELRYEWQRDAFRLIAHDAFLSTLGIAIDEERFDLAEWMLSKAWLMKEPNGSNRPATSDYTEFRHYLKSLEFRKQRLKLNRIDLQADLVKDAHGGGALPTFESVMQADLIAFIRSGQFDIYHQWYPTTLVYAVDRFAAFPAFARAEATSYLKRLLPVLGCRDLAGLKARLAELSSGRRVSQMFDHQGFPLGELANLKHLGSRE